MNEKEIRDAIKCTEETLKALKELKANPPKAKVKLNKWYLFKSETQWSRVGKVRDISQNGKYCGLYPLSVNIATNGYVRTISSSSKTLVDILSYDEVIELGVY